MAIQTDRIVNRIITSITTTGGEHYSRLERFPVCAFVSTKDKTVISNIVIYFTEMEQIVINATQITSITTIPRTFQPE